MVLLTVKRYGAGAEGLEGVVAEMRALRIAFCEDNQLAYACSRLRRGQGTHDDLGIPVRDFGVVIFFCVGEGGITGL